MIVGKSENPIYLFLHDDKADICDAASLWGLDVECSERIIKKVHGKVSAAIIGPGGENLVRFGCIMNDTNRAIGRGGTEAVIECEVGNQSPKLRFRCMV